jgi:APA family basic amino acid/polyamine antiporter
LKVIFMIDPVSHEADQAHLPRVLGPLAALCVVVGSVIGSGIFIVPARVASLVPSMGGIALLWVVGGLFSLAGALTLAELGAMLPQAGGPYVYLREAYGRLPAFLFGWTEFLVIRSGSMATLAAACALNIAQLIPAPAGFHPQVWLTGWAVAAMVLVAFVNVIGTKVGGRVQIVGTALKIGALGAMMISPFILGKASVSQLTPVLPAGLSTQDFLNFMIAMVGVLWTYDGWVNTTELAEEIKDPGKNIPRSLMLGMFILIAVYLGMTLVYHLVLPMSVMAGAAQPNSPIVAAIFSKTLFGSRGLQAISLVVMGSTLISLNGNALSGPRAYFAMARDGLFPQFLRKIHPKFQTPANAIIAQSAWAIAITTLGTIPLVIAPSERIVLHVSLLPAWVTLNKTPLYDLLYNYVIFGGTIIYTLTITSVFVLRVKRPDLHRPYRTWGYPITPLIYVASSFLLMGSMLNSKPSEAIAGLGLILLGIPVYWILLRKSSSPIES